LRPWGASRVFASPLARSAATAAIIAETLGLDVEIDARLRERDNWGDVADEPFEVFAERWKQCDSDREWVPPHRESARQAGERLNAFVEDVLTRGVEGPVLAVAHGGVIVDYLLNQHPASELAAIDPAYRHMPYCGLTEVVVASGSTRISRLSDPCLISG
jgi:broad specificity phosphatase PhoE